MKTFKTDTGYLILRSYLFSFTVSIAAAIVLFFPLKAAAGDITIIHTADLNSHAEGAGFAGYCGDRYRGGLVKAIGYIKQERKIKKDSLLVFDSGGFSRGSILHTVAFKDFPFFRMMADSGYNAVNLGTDEYFLGDSVFRHLVSPWQRENNEVHLLTSGITFLNNENPGRLQAAVMEKHIKTYTLYTVNGVSIAVMGIPSEKKKEYLKERGIYFTNVIGAVKAMVKEVRSRGDIDFIVVLSYGGSKRDRQLIDEVDGIDLVLGKSEEKAPAHSLFGDTHLFRPDPFGKNLWHIDLHGEKGNVFVRSHRLVDLRNREKDPKTHSAYVKSKGEINSRILKRLNLQIGGPVAETSFPFDTSELSNSYRDLLNDALHRFYQRISPHHRLPPVDIVITMGKNNLNVCTAGNGYLYPENLFLTLPDSVSEEGEFLDHPVLFKLTVKELKLLLEMACNFKKHIGDEYSPYFSGLRVFFNKYRLPLDKVTSIEIPAKGKAWEKLENIEDEEKSVYIISTELTLQKLRELDNHPIGFFEIKPKGLVHLKEKISGNSDMFSIVTGYLESFGDTTGNGIPDVPEKYRKGNRWLQEKNSAALTDILRNPSSFSSSIFTLAALILLLFISLNVAVTLLFKKTRKRNDGTS